jgi:hypothetical protein
VRHPSDVSLSSVSRLAVDLHEARLRSIVIDDRSMQAAYAKTVLYRLVNLCLDQGPPAPPPMDVAREVITSIYDLQEWVFDQQLIELLEDVVTEATAILIKGDDA